MDISQLLQQLHEGDPRSIGRAVSLVEDHDPAAARILAGLDQNRVESSLVLGITGPPGAGKSTLTAALVKHLRARNQRVGIIGVDPSSPVSGGALLGDRIRMMDHALDKDVVVRSMATRGRLGGLCASAGAAVRILAAGGCTTVIIETVGIGQSEMDIIKLADMTIMVLAPGFGDDIQAMKAGILEVADLLVVNKADLPGTPKLLLDLGLVFGSAEERELRLLQTVASEDKGLDIVLERVTMLAEKHRHDGTMASRRRHSFAVETLDWAMEMLRPRLEEMIKETQDSVDPRLSAREILTKMEQGYSQ